MDTRDATTLKTAASDSSSGAQAYLSLIQQYLSVFMVENAAFYADRCVAEYPDCEQALYLQALCAYRLGKPQTARHLLERCKMNGHMQFLAAQCSVDLKDYTRAEDCLLKETRQAFRLVTPATNMDEWILQTSVRVACDVVIDVS